MYHHYATQLAAICIEVKPFPVFGPKLAVKNLALAESLNLAHLFDTDHTLLEALFSPTGELQIKSVAQKYGGHQFGQWNPHLGDGRGLLLGEVKNNQQQLIDLHLKGAGPTPYSRHADGRAVLRSTIREYLASEALHHLGIPSSRALALITSNEPIVREQREKGAMMIRTCPSHIRFGHFEYFYHANMTKELDALFEFCLEHHFTEASGHVNPHLALLTEIARSTAVLVAKWQAYGFNHGVMNTDNMSIHGITFDFGPYAFLDDFIPQYICNKSDHAGRYAFNQQPSIALWNLNALAHAFSNKLTMGEIKEALRLFEPTFIAAYRNEMLNRFGFEITSGELQSHNDSSLDALNALSTRFVKLLSDEFADYHQSFRLLSNSISNIQDGDYQSISQHFHEKASFERWAKDLSQHLRTHVIDSELMQQKMLTKNPKYVLRNHLMQQAIAKANNDDFSMVDALITVTKSPFDEHPELSHLARVPSEKDKGIAISCSS
ncbi:MAG: hypothetical protein ACJAVV_000312 [Alphaproteobacteria bacterium]